MALDTSKLPVREQHEYHKLKKKHAKTEMKKIVAKMTPEEKKKKAAFDKKHPVGYMSPAAKKRAALDAEKDKFWEIKQKNYEERMKRVKGK